MLVTIQINGQQYVVNQKLSVLEACEYIGINIPRFCYHQRLSIAGNCRMCLVELLNSPKPVASCAFPVANNLSIFTDSAVVKKARENVLETLLLNHPLDCPICDQAGECDLQDQAKTFGFASTRFFFKKRVVEDKVINPLIKTIMSRCIHCTRCVRFNAEISGNLFLGTLLRGTSTEIGSYVYNTNYLSELSGNVIDVCPVGALTSKTYSFKSRPWELKVGESIDLSDGLGAQLYVNFKENEISRIFPKSNDNLSNDFITDKARFSYDAFQARGLKKNNSSSSFSQFAHFLKAISLFTSSSRKDTFQVVSICDNDIDFESFSFLSNLGYVTPQFKVADNVSVPILFRSFLTHSLSTLVDRFNFFINWSTRHVVSQLETLAQVCFLVCCNLKLESALINLKLRKKAARKNLSIFGFNVNVMKNELKIETLNLAFHGFLTMFEGKQNKISYLFFNAISPVIFFNENLSRRGVQELFFKSFLKQIVPNAVLFNIQVSSNNQGLAHLDGKAINTRFLKKMGLAVLLNLEESFFAKKYLDSYKMILWANTYPLNRDLFSSSLFSTVFLNSHFEEEKIFFNLEQRPQKTSSLFNPFKSETLSIGQVFSKLCSILYADTMVHRYPTNFYNYHLLYISEILYTPKLFLDIIVTQESISGKLLTVHPYNVNSTVIVSKYPAKNLVEDFFLIGKSSQKSKYMKSQSLIWRKHHINLCTSKISV
ncbi:MAG: dehydrogenase subunit 11 [Bacteroidota bacterium]